MNLTSSPQALKLLSLTSKVEGVPLVFLPDLGGNVLYSRDLVARLTEGISPRALPLTNEALGTLDTITIEDLAERFSDVLIDYFPTSQVHLAGFSFAGILAFETARALARKKHPPAHVWLFDTRAHRLHLPSAIRQAPFRELKSFGTYILKRLSTRNSAGDDNVLRSFRFVEVDLNTRPKAFWPIIRSMHRALSIYRPIPTAEIPVTLFQVNELPSLHARPLSLGWDRLTQGTARVVPVDAEHLTVMHAEPSLDCITEYLKTHCRTF